ncbi:1960_t:CDS:2 [Entrophospora sp. SA101]|nr:1960_t:CDS:2 [Entrophospora sp. SA101]CAJ0910633.1 19420_t:CDS:2 [Entrophospora sp. SA101]CAJ0910654.1 19427_t:CDS:2 [Entrophospora sp. SA101]
MSNFHKKLNEVGLQTDPDPTDAAIISLLQEKYLFRVTFPTLGNDKVNETLKISSDNYPNGNKLQKSKESSSLFNNTTTPTTTKLLHNNADNTLNNASRKDFIGSSSSATSVKPNNLIYVPPQKRVENYKYRNEDSVPFTKQPVKEIQLYKIPQKSSSNKEENHSTTNRGAWNAVPPQRPIKNDDLAIPVPPQQPVSRDGTWDVTTPQQSTKKNDWVASAPLQQSPSIIDSWNAYPQQQQSAGAAWNASTQQSTRQVPWGTATTDIADNSSNNNSWLKQASAFEEELGTKNIVTNNENTEKPPRDNYNEKYSNYNNGYEYQGYGKRGFYKCEGTGHRVFECPYDPIKRISKEEAWEKMMKADAEKNIEDFKEMFEHYSKAAPNETFQTIETNLRKAGCNTKIIALEREAIPFRKCLVDLQGNEEKRYLAVLTMRDPNKFPKSSGYRAEQNFMWLQDSGFMKDDLTSLICYKCKKKGHLPKDCPEPRKEYKPTFLACQNCDSTEHITKYCRKERHDYENRRGGGRQSGGRECYKYGSSDHLSRDCNNSDGGGGGFGDESKSNSYYNNNTRREYGDYGNGGGGFDTSNDFVTYAIANINNEDDWKKTFESAKYNWGVPEDFVEKKANW